MSPGCLIPGILFVSAVFHYAPVAANGNECAEQLKRGQFLLPPVGRLAQGAGLLSVNLS